MLKDAKEQCDILVIGLQNDPTLDKDYRIKTNGKQKNIPIQNLEERKIQLMGCKYIDYIVEYDTEESLYKILIDVKPDLRILGSDWKNKLFTGHNLDIPIYWHNRQYNYSTSNLRKRIYTIESENAVLNR